MIKGGGDSMLKVAVDAGEDMCNCNILLSTYGDKPYALHQVGSLKIEVSRDEVKNLEELSHKKANRLSEMRDNTLKALKELLMKLTREKCLIRLRIMELV